MGDLNGDVLALATIGIYVFVAGDFTVTPKPYYARVWGVIRVGLRCS
jgi:hypothetical protein